MLLAGELDDAKAQAFALAKAEADPGMAPWAAESRALVDAARWLASARDLPDAVRREARVAAACAECHLRAQKLPVFHPTLPPADLPTITARMARHQWAVDRLWEGVVGADDAAWRSGLEVLATTPLPFAAAMDADAPAPALARRVQAGAHDALATRLIDSPEDRATAYGELLVACTACHATFRATKR